MAEKADAGLPRRGRAGHGRVSGGAAGDAVLPSEILKMLVSQVEGTDIEELDIRLGTARIRLRQEPSQEPAESLDTEKLRTQDARLAIEAPLTGVYYSRPAPDQPPFIEVGTSIGPGQVVALIETMKLFNQVLSEVEGTVAAIEVTDGDLVEKGQPLMRIEVSDGGIESPTADLDVLE